MPHDDCLKRTLVFFSAKVEGIAKRLAESRDELKYPTRLHARRELNRDLPKGVPLWHIPRFMRKKNNGQC